MSSALADSGTTMREGPGPRNRPPQRLLRAASRPAGERPPRRPALAFGGSRAAWPRAALAGLLLTVIASAPASPAAAQNATGAPAVAGEAYVGETLTAGPGDIADDDGLTTPGYSYVWTRVDADGESNATQVGTAGTYTLVAADEGKKIKLEATFTDDESNSETRDVLFPSVGTVDPTPGDDVVWATTMTVEEASSGARGFDRQDGFGDLVETTFTVGTLSHEVEALFAGPHSGGYVEADEWVVFQLDLLGSRSALADPDDYTLEFAGGEFPLSDATEDTDAVRQLFPFTKAWVASNASPLSETNYQTTLPDGATVNVLLRSTPAPELEFDAATFNVAEDADSVEVKVKLSAAHTATVEVDYATSDNTALAGSDYTSRSGTLTFDPGDTEKTFHVLITDDAVYEPTQRFIVTLSDPSNADLGTQGSVAQVVITDDEAVPTVTLADVSVAEGDGTMTMTLALSHLSEVATTYQTSTSLVGGTATAGTDYTSFVTGTSLDFTVPAGDMSATLDITITDDAVPEADETITVSWQHGGSVATPTSLSFTGTITDNDPVVVGYDPTAYSVDEDDGSVTLTLKVLDPASGGAPRAFVVQLNTHDVTAASSDDYGSVSGQQVQFNAGETDKTHSINIIDDSDDENNETFGSAVTVFSGLAEVKEDADTATVTIVDNDGSTNNPATGEPAVSGAAYVGETLTAGPGDIADDDGLTSPGYSYVWTRVDDDGQSNPLQVGTAGTYTLVAADEGKKIKLEATFTDDGSESETREVLFPSVGTVDATPGSDVVWATTMTVGEATEGARGHDSSVDPQYRFGSVDDGSFTVGTLDHFVDALFAGPHGGWTETAEWVVFQLNFSPGTGNSFLADPDNYTVEFAGEEFPLSDATPSTLTSVQLFAFTKAWVASNASPLSETNYQSTLPDGATLNVLLRQTNNSATGQPEITGTPQAGQTLTATAGDMDDADDLPTTTFPAGYSFRWLRVDGSDETPVGTDSHQYPVVADDVGKTIKVEVTFTDGGDTEETLASDETGAVVAKQEDCATDRAGSDWCATMTVATWMVGTTNNAGYHGNVSGRGQLDDASFDIGSYTVTVEQIVIQDKTSEDQVALGTVDNNTSGWAVRDVVFDFGGTEFTADAASEQTLFGNQFNFWPRPANFTWIKGQKVTVSAKLPSSQNAMGKPVITGPAQVDMTLTADTTAITDADGLGTFSYKWFRGSTAITNATNKTYVPVAADVGHALKVEVTFTDSASIAEVVTSDASSVVVPAAAENCSADGTVWCTTVTVGYGTADSDGEFWLGFGREVGTADEDFGTMDDSTFTIGTTEYRVTQLGANTDADELFFATNPELSGDGFTLHLQTITDEAHGSFSDAPLATNGNFDDRIRTFNGLLAAHPIDPNNVPLLRGSPLSSTNAPYGGTSDKGLQFAIRLSQVVANATGKPNITGPAQVGMTLTADTDSIMDTDGLTTVSYDYQWIRYDSDGTSNPDTLSMQTSSTYALTSADLGKTLKVEVSFEDDESNAETLTSDATNPVVPAAAACGSDELWCAQLTVGYGEPDMDDEFNLGFRTGTNGYGTLTDSTFTHNSVDYDITLVRGPAVSGGSNTLGFSTSPNLPADGAGLTLHIQTITGESDLLLSDYTLNANGIWQIDGGVFALDLNDLPMLRGLNASQGDYERQTDQSTVFRVRLTAAPDSPELGFDNINVNVAEDADSVGLKVNLSPAHTATVTVNYETRDNTATAGDDYTSRSGMLTFDPGDTEQTIYVPLIDDQSYGNAKRFNILLSSPSGADLGTDSLAQVTISNDEAVPTATMEDVSVDEADGTMTLTLRLSHPSELDTRYNTFPGQVGGTATEGADYVSFITGSRRSLTVPTGDLSATLDITIIDDGAAERDETIVVHWEHLDGDATPARITFTGTILNDDTVSEVVELLDATLTVGATGQRDSGFGCSSTSDYECADAMSDRTFSSTDAAGVTRDFTINGLSIMIPASGETAGDKNLFFWIDRSSPFSDYENHHLVLVLDGRQFPFRGTDSSVDGVLNKVWFDTGLSWSVGQTVEVKILDMANPPLTRAPWLAVADAEGHEADGFIDFPVTLNRPSQGVRYSATVEYETSNGTARAGADYRHTTGTLSFAADETEQTVRVPLIDDNVEDDGETFTLTLSDPERATIADQYATGTIRNSELPVLSVADASATEGSAVVFTVSLSRTSSQQVTVAYATSGVTATSGTDFTATSGTLTFAAGDSSQTVSVATTDDSDHEQDETFTLALSSPTGATLGEDATATGTINDNDDAPPPLTAQFLDVPAAHDGTTAFTVRVSFSAPLKQGGSGIKLARALSLTGARPGAVRRADGQSTDLYKFDVRPTGTDTITIALPETTDCAADDAVCTGDGRPLSHPLLATVAGPATTPTPPTMSVADASATEGSAVVFTVSLSAASSDTVTVAYATSGVTATSGTDFTAASGTLSFAPNETSKTVSVATTDDSDDEDDETFTLRLSSPANATLGDATATGTINDNDDAAALTAQFLDVPDAHDGTTAFTVRISFSEPLKQGGSGVKLARALSLTGATRGSVRRADGQSTDLYKFDVRPTGADTIVIALPETTDCAATDAVCTGDGRPLSHSLSDTVPSASSSSTAGDAPPGDMEDDRVAEALALVDGVTPDEAAAALLGGGDLSGAQLRALDRLGNGNGLFDLGDVLSWRDRCGRGEADCGGTSGDAGPGGAAFLLLAAGRRRGRSGRGSGSGPGPRGRVPARRAPRRAKYAVGVLLAAVTAWSCGDGAVGPVAPAAAVPDPGFLTVEFTAPPARRDIGVLLELEGPGIEAVRAPSLEVYESAASGPHRVILAGSVGAGPLMQFRVPDRNRLSLYRVRVIQVTGEDYGLRDAGEYRAVLKY